MFQGPKQTYVAAAALERGDMVKFTAGALTLIKGIATTDSFGCVSKDYAIGDACEVIMFTPGHVVELRVAGTVALDALLYPAADGECDDAVTTGSFRGKALEVGAANQIISVLVTPALPTA